jgi:hypothetical protein
VQGHALAGTPIWESNLSEAPTRERRADLVLTLGRPPVRALVVEVQLSRDSRKRFSWPAYLTSLRERLRVPVELVVIAPSPKVAAWARRPIATGHPGFDLSPTVLSGAEIPRITNPREAARAPELAMLSVLAHGHEPDALAVATAALGAARVLDRERAADYHELIWMSVAKPLRRKLEEKMRLGNREYITPISRPWIEQGRAQGRAEGRVEGRAEYLVAVAEMRGMELTPTQRGRILACRDMKTLDRWLRRALVAEKASELFHAVGSGARRPSARRRSASSRSTTADRAQPSAPAPDRGARLEELAQPSPELAPIQRRDLVTQSHALALETTGSGGERNRRRSPTRLAFRGGYRDHDHRTPSKPRRELGNLDLSGSGGQTEDYAGSNRGR